MYVKLGERKMSKTKPGNERKLTYSLVIMQLKILNGRKRETCLSNSA